MYLVEKEMSHEKDSGCEFQMWNSYDRNTKRAVLKPTPSFVEGFYFWHRFGGKCNLRKQF